VRVWPNDALVAFTEAAALMKPCLLGDLAEREGFLDRDERTYLILHRAAQALLGLKYLQMGHVPGRPLLNLRSPPDARIHLACVFHTPCVRYGSRPRVH
jgi:hypothetical protein